MAYPSLVSESGLKVPWTHWQDCRQCPSESSNLPVTRNPPSPSRCQCIKLHGLDLLSPGQISDSLKASAHRDSDSAGRPQKSRQGSGVTVSGIRVWFEGFLDRPYLTRKPCCTALLGCSQGRYSAHSDPSPGVSARQCQWHAWYLV